MLQGNVLLTGGSGTLGRAMLLVAQRENWPAQFTVFARSEGRLARLRRAFPSVRTIVGDVRDSVSVSGAVAGHDIVVHMAAMKRIPECEEYPHECIATNVQGTENVLRACTVSGVYDVVVISTDKACQAATVYGASKLLLEGLMAAYARDYRRTGVCFHGVRYGNVIASNGSVVQLWMEQHEARTALTVTDIDMTRFWMSPFDAVHLIVQARGQPSGVLVVPKMKSLKIVDMAHMLYPDDYINVIGLRSNEKVYEDLVHPYEVAEDVGEHFHILLGNKRAKTTGLVYHSLMCPRLSANELLSMVADAREVEACW